MRFLFLYFGPLPYTLIATTSVQNGTEKLEKKIHQNNFNFLFLYEVYRKKEITPFHFNSANSVFCAELLGEDSLCL